MLLKFLKKFFFNFFSYFHFILKIRKIKFIAENIMARSKIPPFNLMDHLTKIFMGTVHSIGNQDAEFISEYAETDFGKTLLEKSQNLLKNGYKVLNFV